MSPAFLKNQGRYEKKSPPFSRLEEDEREEDIFTGEVLAVLMDHSGGAAEESQT